MHLRDYLRIKKANSVNRTLRGMGGSALAGAVGGRRGLAHAGTAGRIGGFAGNFGDADMDELADAYNSVGKDFIPGVAAYRMNRQRRAIEKLLKAKRGKNGGNKTLSENLGILTSSIAPMAIGGILGGRKSKFKNDKDIEKGVRTGAVLAGGANALGALSTLFTKGRSKEDLDDYYNSGAGATLANYLLPGSAAYNKFKNQAATDRLIEEYMDDPEAVNDFMNEDYESGDDE